MCSLLGEIRLSSKGPETLSFKAELEVEAGAEATGTITLPPRETIGAGFTGRTLNRSLKD